MLFSKIDLMPKKGCIFGVALNNLETYVENVVQTVIFTKSPKNKDDDSTPPCRKPNILPTDCKYLLSIITTYIFYFS